MTFFVIRFGSAPKIGIPSALDQSWFFGVQMLNRWTDAGPDWLSVEFQDLTSIEGAGEPLSVKSQVRVRGDQISCVVAAGMLWFATAAVQSLEMRRCGFANTQQIAPAR